MRKSISILPTLVALLFIGCAAPITQIPLSLQVSRGDSYLLPSDTSVPDSVDYTLFRRDSYRWGDRIIKRVDRVVFTPEGYMLRENTLSEHITSQDSLPDTWWSSKTHKQNIFNEKGELVESREYVNDTLREVRRFAYNKKGQVVEWESQYIPEENYVPLKYLYTYDRYGNISSKERYENGVFQGKVVTRYNRKGQKLEEYNYRADGVLEEGHIYAHNRHGDVVESSWIEELGKIHMIDGIDWNINPLERDYWNKNQTPQKPIEQYDTISTRTTYHSRGKIATEQKRRASQGNIWKTASRTEYNSKGVPTRKMEYGSEIDTLVTRLTIYNSRGLPTEEYRYDRESGAMEITNRKEYDDRGKCILELSYGGLFGMEVSCKFYDREGNLVDECDYCGGVLERRTVTQYENGRVVQRVKYGKKGRLKRTEVFEYGDGCTKSTVYDKDGAVIRTTLSNKSDNLSVHLEYDGNGELLIDSRTEYFR